MGERPELQDAIEMAAGRSLGLFLFTNRDERDARRVARVRKVILRFLQNVDDTLSVVELRKELEDMEPQNVDELS
jgi:hypothetical protein